MASGVYQPIHPHLLAGDRTRWGAALWAQLHTRADEYQGDAATEDQWLQEFMEAIPCPDCQRHFWRHCEQTPPDLSSQGNYRVWAWWAHQLVNLKIGKPVYPWPVRLWGPPPLKIREDLVDNP